MQRVATKSVSSRRRLRAKVATDVRRWIPILILCLTLLAPLATPAQSFTNSATLTASMEGTNLVVTWSMTTTQGWVTLFQAD